MEVHSIENLCKYLISCAIQRCRILDDLCRLSVSLRSTPPVVRLSVSDTGIGSTLEEFRKLKFLNDTVLSGKWAQRYFLVHMESVVVKKDGVVVFKNDAAIQCECTNGALCVATTSISDDEIHNIKFNLKEVASSKRLTRLASASKNGSKFSGTEVSFSTSESWDTLLAALSVFIQKMHILKAPKIAIELLIDSSGGLTPQFESIFLQNACSSVTAYEENIDYLKSGLEDYVFKHGNRVSDACHSCFPERESIKIGTALACNTGRRQHNALVIEVVIIISEISPTESSCFRTHGSKTEVLYFEDFSPCSLPQSSLDALANIKWKTYGLALKSIADQDGLVLIEWENLPTHAHIDIGIHSYHKHVMIPPCTKINRSYQNLIRKAVKLALDEMKVKNEGVLLSEHAVKMSSYAPDLAKTLAGLILSSNDSSFRGDCFSLLGLQFPETEWRVIEDSIKERIMSVIMKNDRIPHKSREAAFLFEDGSLWEPDFPDEELEDGENTSSPWDL